MVNTYLIDTLFEKFTKYAGRLIFKDSVAADKEETEESKIFVNQLTKELSEKNYFALLNSGNLDEAEKILEECSKNYTELNSYYINLSKLTGILPYKLRQIGHLNIVASTNIEDLGLSSNDEISFKTLYASELDYFNTAQFRFDFIEETLFNKLVICLLSFSTILRLIKQNQDLYITDQNVSEYYLNNFLVSHGFLYYNNISYDKKKIFTKNIIEFYNGKGSLQCISEIINILNDKEIDIYEYYLFYDSDVDDYFFLKVKPNESFLAVVNEYRSDRAFNCY